MTSLSAKQAADAVGITKQGIIKSIRDGKISAEKGLKGEWKIQPVELFRVYKPVHPVDNQPNEKSLSSYTPLVDSSLQFENLELRLKLEAAEKEISGLKADKEDYKRRLDGESQERQKLTMLLSDMRPKAEKKPTEARKGFLARLLSKSD